ncbi:hypothetical protein C2E23DRAFT_927391 [Lenzites betulinus]|nr:hypothetical protein C2E23DRAFT_927391 [Lenzites betulinus]
MTVVSIRDQWSGVAKLKHLIVFGASYCDVGYNSVAPHPSPENPLGVEFPGKTFCGKVDHASKRFIYEPNWVGHLVETTRRNKKDPPLIVYDYALGGECADGVKRQVEREFLPSVATKPEWAPWNATDTLFVTWVGINDCSSYGRNFNAAIGCQQGVRELFASQEKLYEAGARNFCFIDVPPTHDFPPSEWSIPADLRPFSAGPRLPKLPEAISAWNIALNEAAREFSAEHSDATVLLWSSWQFFTKLLAAPEEFGFHQDDVRQEEGPIFVDGLHPTSAVHSMIAQDLLKFLSGLERPEVL